MTTEEAWPIVHEAMQASPHKYVFGYGFSDNRRDIDMSCEACGRHTPLPLANATLESIREAMSHFEALHVVTCAERFAEAQERLRELAKEVPSFSSAREATDAMRRLSGLPPKKPN